MKLNTSLIVLLAFCFIAYQMMKAPPPPPPTGPPGSDAAALYQQAADAIQVDSPASTTMPSLSVSYPPHSAEWMGVEESAWNANSNARDLARGARSLKDAAWADEKAGVYLHKLNRLANDLGDAALYADSRGDDASAVEFVRDILHLRKLLEEKPSAHMYLVRVLFSKDLEMLATERLMLIASGVALTNDPSNPHALQVKTAHDLIAQLLDPREQRAELADIYKAMGAPPEMVGTATAQKVLETMIRADAEESLAAMSLACHLFQFDKGRWPASLEELIPDYLPRAMVDPWGDGQQTLGYLLIKSGLPDGSDRPLVFSRCDSPLILADRWRDNLNAVGMFVQLNQPEYGFYEYSDSQSPRSPHVHGGQFRDVARWEPAPNYAGPATRPVAEQRT